MERKYNWVDDSIKIDFPLPAYLQALVDELEEMDQNEDYCYFDRCSYIENCTKEFVIERVITSKQRDLLCERYHGG